MSIDFIQGKSADKVLHFFEKQMSNPEKMTKSEKNVFFDPRSFLTMTMISASVSHH